MDDNTQIMVSLARIEEQLEHIVARLEEIDELDDRVAKVERDVAWVRAWSAGAAAAAVGVLGALAWIAVKLPGLTRLALP